MMTPIVSSKYRYLYQFCYVKVFSTNHNRNLPVLDDRGRVRSQIASRYQVSIVTIVRQSAV